MKKGDIDFSQVDPAHRLYTRTGVVVNNLPELLHALEGMDSASYDHHVTFYKNDFAHWVRTVIGDEKLALRLFEASNQKEMIKELKKVVKKKTPAKKTTGLGREEQIVRRVLEGSKLLEKINALMRQEQEMSKREQLILDAEQRLEKEIQDHREKEVRFSFFILFIGFIIGFFLSVLLFTFV